MKLLQPPQGEKGGGPGPGNSGDMSGSWSLHPQASSALPSLPSDPHPQAPSRAFVDLYTLEPTFWAAEPFVGQMNSALEQLEEGDEAAGRAGLGHIEVSAQGH